MMHKEFEIRNEKAKLVAVCPTFDQAARLVKHHQPDGIYSVVGPDTDCTLTRSNGTSFQTSGTICGTFVSPRSLEEAKNTFGEPVTRWEDDLPPKGMQ